MRVVLLFCLVLISIPARAACNETLLDFVSWTIRPLNADTNEMTTVFKSNAPKTIREIDASAGFKELDGEEIGCFKLFEYLMIEAGAEVTETTEWGPHTFEGPPTRKPAELTTFVCVRSVKYEDGTQQSFE